MTDQGTSMAAAPRLSLAEFLALPETEPASEYACGASWQKPMPTQAHMRLQKALLLLLEIFLLRTRLGESGAEWGCLIGPPGAERLLVPDVAYVRRGRRAPGPHHQGAPDLAIEILSPGQSLTRLMEKVQVYLRHGARAVWVLDPAERTVLCLTPVADPRLVDEADTLEGAPVLPGFRFPVSRLFAVTDDPDAVSSLLRDALAQIEQP